MRIETERLVLRRWRADDAPALEALFRHPGVARWLGPPEPGDIERMLQRYEHSWETRGYGRFAVEDRASGALLGRAGVMWQQAWTGTPEKDEIGWVTDPARWGEGLATEAARAALDDAFARVGLPRVVSFALPENTASVRVMEKCGLVFGGHAEWAGQPHVWYSIASPYPDARR